MGLFKKAFLLAIIAIVVYFIFLQPKDSYEFGGYVKPGFEKVQSVFKQNFLNGLDNEGAAFAVCRNGDMVVDLWGGFADSESEHAWKQDTLTTAFSVTKAVSALCLAMLVDRGLLSYDDLVVKHWPEFGKHEKEKTTIKMLASHEAGLVALDENVTFDSIRDWKKMSAILENQKPNWEVKTMFNNPDFHMLEIGAANGIGTARALAKLFCLVDSGKIINKTTIERLMKPVWTDSHDLVLRISPTWGWGFYHTENPEGNYQIGHPGYGGQYLKYDPDYKLSFAYLRNGLVHTGPDLQAKSFVNLENAIYSILKKRVVNKRM